MVNPARLRPLLDNGSNQVSKTSTVLAISLGISLILALVIPFSGAHADTSASGTLVIHAATWSGKSILSGTREHCQGKPACEFLTSPRFLGEATDVNDKSISIDWGCTSNPEVHHLTSFSHDATDFRFELSCPGLPQKPTPAKEPLETTHHSYAYRKILLDSKYTSQFGSDLQGGKCLGAVRTVLASGHTLYSEVLEQLIVPASRKIPGGELFHYTKAPAVKELIGSAKLSKLEKLDELFKFVRTRELNHDQYYRRLGWRNFFVASDRSSSSVFGFGSILVKFKLGKDAKMLTYDERIWREAIADMAARYPVIQQNCDLKFGYAYDALGTAAFQNFIPVMAEEMGVDILDYNQNDHWWQLLSPVHVESVGLE